jgi:hypothetical protein
MHHKHLTVLGMKQHFKASENNFINSGRYIPSGCGWRNGLQYGG